MSLAVAEEWRPVTDSDGKYEVSNLGRVRSLYDQFGRLRPEKLVLAKNVPLTEYVYVKIGKRKRLAHVMVLESFVGPRPPGFQASHIDGMRQNNALTNLVWESAKDNMGRKSAHGTTRRNGIGYSAKLDAFDVRIIRKMRQRGFSTTEIAHITRNSRQNIIKILQNKSWAHLTEPVLPAKKRSRTRG